jgi:hypothetical protein
MGDPQHARRCRVAAERCRAGESEQAGEAFETYLFRQGIIEAIFAAIINP